MIWLDGTMIEGVATGAAEATGEVIFDVTVSPMSGKARDGVKRLVEKDGKREYVADYDNYPDWTIVGVGEAAAPVEDGEWDGERHVVPIAILRRRKRDEVNRVRQQYQDGGCVTPHGIADTDERSKVNAAGCTQMADRALAKAARDGVPCEWSLVYTMHESNPVPNVTVDAEQMGEIGEAVGYHIGKCHAVGVLLKNMIKEADEATLAAIDVEAFYAGAFA